ncbi:PREDICTED: uncharacterized protein LOC109188931 [Ipomoea nil]|uniref:uncharacterized protein LOC109188931 n=1 Tax=Ipomoea nil TaxID=35883 RepID=UPI000901606B|nr:PREDICTED: uncharacterized protein LOC109188931 [Ipomoea nil]
MELLLEKLVKGQFEITKRLDRMDTRQNMVENQLANQPSISSTKVTGKLPAMPEKPREHMNAVTTRSRKQLLDPPYPNGEQVVKKNLEGENEKVNEGVIAQDKEDEIQEIEPVKKHTPPLPFPQKFQKSREEERRANFYSLIKQLDITIPFIDAVTETPSYAKFLKEILSNKRRAENRETVAVSEECSALIQNKLPPKLRDPGSFSIPCVIGGSLVQKALCDLGASVSLMPYSLCQKLQLGEPKPTSITLQLADRSVKYPIGILEDVPVKIDKFYIPGDFVVLEMEEDAKIPIILGRPFLATAGAIINVKKGTLVLEIGEDKVEFNVFELANKSSCLDSCFYVDEIDSCIATYERGKWISNDPLQLEGEDSTKR